MDPTTQDKLAINVANAWKMASNYVIVGASAVATAYLALPVVCDPAAAAGCVSQHAIQAWVIASLHIPPLLVPILVGAGGVIARVWPQKSITPAVAEAKSAAAPLPTISGDPQA